MKTIIFLLISIIAIGCVQNQVVKNTFQEEVVKNTFQEEIIIKGKKTVKMSAFKMDKYEVTNKKYYECVNAGVCKKPHYYDENCSIYNRGQFKEDNKPVVCVDFNQAQTYCEWKGKRLPTEEEWEYAAKGGQYYTYSGSDNADEVAWYKENSNDQTHKIGTKKANGYGLYDTTGNVWEWTESWYDSSDKYRVLRGGGFGNGINYVRIDYRFYFNPTKFGNDYGFRCVWSE